MSLDASSGKSKKFAYSIEKKLTRPDGSVSLGRAGKIETPHGVVLTPAFITVGTKATVKALTSEQVGGVGGSATASVGAQAVLANTYHLYLQPGHELLEKAGGLGKFMDWNGPTFTDSGGFQVFSLGAAFSGFDHIEGASGKAGDAMGVAGAPKMKNRAGMSKISVRGADAQSGDPVGPDGAAPRDTFAKIDEEGVTFRSVIDGSDHRFTPERSIAIQHAIGADIMFAFDECTSPLASREYQLAAMDRTHRWAQRCIDEHDRAGRISSATGTQQALFGVVQGGRFEDLRKESARIIGSMKGTIQNPDGTTTESEGFDGFGIGGSFEKEDIYTAVGWVNEILPENKPRHLLGIGEPEDLFGGVEHGADTFDCVAPTRIARHGTLYTTRGKIHIKNEKYENLLGPFDADETGKSLCDCYTCTHHTAAYLAHLFKAHEMLAGTLASIHNLHFITKLVADIRASIISDTFFDFKKAFLEKYLGIKQ
jgi:queuine tRNA-ribosyltransferase